MNVEWYYTLITLNKSNPIKHWMLSSKGVWFISSAFLFFSSTQLFWIILCIRNLYFWRAQDVWWRSILCNHIVSNAALLFEVGDTSSTSAWRSTCLMHSLVIKRFGLAWKEVNHCLRNEVKRIRPMWRRNWEGDDNTMMMKAAGFHFFLSSHVRMNLQNDTRGQFKYEQFEHRLS